jgi:hypothetical protein
MRHGLQDGKQRRQELARLAMAIATKEENAQRGTKPQLPTVQNQTSDLQSPDNERQRVPLEMRNML